MSPKPPTRRRSDADAGTGPVREEAPAVLAAVPAPASAARAEQPKPRKFTALLDADTDARYGRLLAAVRDSVGPVATRSDGNGGTRAGYDVSRADLLRALLEVAADDPSVMADVQAKVRHHYGATP